MKETIEENPVKFGRIFNLIVGALLHLYKIQKNNGRSVKLMAVSSKIRSVVKLCSLSEILQ
jgi:ABC-type transporter Mla MlaB component